MSLEVGADKLNARLADLYLSVWSELTEIVAGEEGCSNPLLMSVGEAYASAPLRLMIVGQETFSWFGGFESGPAGGRIAALQGCYGSFSFGATYRKSPFWRAAHRLRAGLSPESAHDCLAWANLNVVDHDKHRAWKVQDRLADIGILSREIEILVPDAVAFFTGPNYDDILRRQFPGLSLRVVPGFQERALARVVHPQLPERTVRLYHPAYLQRIGRFEAVLAGALEALSATPQASSTSQALKTV